MARTYTLTETEAQMAFRQVKSHIAALHNWTATAVESGKFDYAATLVAELRDYQVLFAKLNVEAHRTIDAARVTANAA